MKKKLLILVGIFFAMCFLSTIIEMFGGNKIALIIEGTTVGIYTILVIGYLIYLLTKFVEKRPKNIQNDSFKSENDSKAFDFEENDDVYEDEYNDICEDTREISKREFLFVCQRCGNEWYMTKKEVRNAKAIKREVTSMKLSRFSTLSLRKHYDLSTKIAIANSVANYNKCPNCGSVNVTKTLV